MVAGRNEFEGEYTGGLDVWVQVGGDGDVVNPIGAWLYRGWLVHVSVSGRDGVDEVSVGDPVEQFVVRGLGGFVGVDQKDNGVGG